MRLISDDVHLDVVSRLMGHSSLRMTERYAHKRAAQVRAELERVHRKRKTVNYQGQIVKGDPRANDPDIQMTRKGVRGQTLAVGGCGRLMVLGPCNYANKCLTCPMCLTSTDDLPALRSFYARALRLRQRGVEVNNQTVVIQQDHIITNLAVRIKSLEDQGTGKTTGGGLWIALSTVGRDASRPRDAQRDHVAEQEKEPANDLKNGIEKVIT